jgi:hypothetical protein
MRLIVLAAVALTGCAGAMMERSSEHARAIVSGKPLETAVQRLGLPASDQTLAGHRVVAWQIGGASGGFDCQLRADVDKGEVIRRYQIEGVPDRCLAWLRDLK